MKHLSRVHLGVAIGLAAMIDVSLSMYLAHKMGWSGGLFGFISGSCFTAILMSVMDKIVKTHEDYD